MVSSMVSSEVSAETAALRGGTAQSRTVTHRGRARPMSVRVPPLMLREAKRKLLLLRGNGGMFDHTVKHVW